MDKSITHRLDTPRLGPSRPATKAATVAAVAEAQTAAAAADALGLQANPREALAQAKLVKVDLQAVNVPDEAAEKPGFFQRALNVFSNALSYVSSISLSDLPTYLVPDFLLKNKKLTPEGQQILQALAKSGMLEAKDDNGVSLQGVLDKLLAGGADPKHLEGILTQLENPRRIRQMRGKNTCPTAVIQKLLAELNPGAYTKAASELLASGKATLPDGTQIEVSAENKAWIEKHTHAPSERINALFQVAMAEAVVKPDRYDVASDMVLPVTRSLRMVEMAIAAPQDGLKYEKVLQTYRHAEMPLYDPRVMANGSPAEQRAVFEAALKKLDTKEGRGLATPVHSDNGAYHMVEVLGMDADGNVTFRDPDTGLDATYTWEQFNNELLGYDITDASDVGGGRVPPPTGGGGKGL